MTRMFKSFVREVWLELLELIEMCKVCFTYPFFFFLKMTACTCSKEEAR